MTALYIGGGSPSTLPPAYAERLFAHLAKVVPQYDTIEKTFTGEPRTLRRPELLKLLQEFKFDRITFGIETFNERIRKSIGRYDTREDIDAVFSGLDAVGSTASRCVDMMYDLPGQTLKDWEEDLSTLVENYQPDELDAFGTVYLPYRPMHRLIVKGKLEQPGSIWQLLKMRELVYDYMLDKGYHNPIGETFSKTDERTQYQKAHCARQDIVAVGCAARGNLKDMVSINPSKLDDWYSNIDQYGVSTKTLQPIGRDGVLDRIMVMFPRYKEIDKDLLNRFSDTRRYPKVLKLLKKQIKLGLVQEHDDRYTLEKLGVLWLGNVQTDYLKHTVNLPGRMLLRTVGEKKAYFDRQKRFGLNAATRFILGHLDLYPRLMK